MLYCGREQLHLDSKNHTEPLNVLILLLTFFCVWGNSIRGKQKERRILYPYLKKKNQFPIKKLISRQSKAMGVSWLCQWVVRLQLFCALFRGGNPKRWMRCTGFDHDTAVLTSTSLAKTSWGLHGWLLPSVSCEMIWWFRVVFLWDEFLFNKKTPVKQALLLIVRGARDWIDDGNCISFSSCSCQHCVKNRAGLNSGKQLRQILNF